MWWLGVKCSALVFEGDLAERVNHVQGDQSEIRQFPQPFEKLQFTKRGKIFGKGLIDR